MKPLIIRPEGPITFEEFRAAINAAYEQGYKDGYQDGKNAAVPYTPPYTPNVPWTSPTYPIITCNSGLEASAQGRADGDGR